MSSTLCSLQGFDDYWIFFFFFFSISRVLYMNKNIRKLQILNKDDPLNLYHRKLTLEFDV